MSDAILVQIAEAVKEALNAAAAGTFNKDFEAIRSYADWELPLEQTEEGARVRVDVTPVPTVASELETRGSIAYSPAVDVITRMRLGPEDRDADGLLMLDEIDSLVQFVEQQAEFFTAETLGSLTARWKETEIRRAFVPAHLREFHQFTAIVRLTFDMSNAL